MNQQTGTFAEPRPPLMLPNLTSDNRRFRAVRLGNALRSVLSCHLRTLLSTSSCLLSLPTNVYTVVNDYGPGGRFA